MHLTFKVEAYQSSNRLAGSFFSYFQPWSLSVSYMVFIQSSNCRVLIFVFGTFMTESTMSKTSTPCVILPLTRMFSLSVAWHTALFSVFHSIPRLRQFGDRIAV